MRILHVISTLDPAYGGPIEGVKHVVHETISCGHIVDILVSDPPDSPWLKGHEFNVFAVGPSFGTFAFSSDFAKWVRRNLHKYDHVVVEGLWQFQGTVVRHYAIKYRIPYYIFTHGQLGTWFKSSYPVKHLKKYIYWLLFERRVLRDARYVLFTTDEEMQQSRISFRPYKCNEFIAGYGADNYRGEGNAARSVFLAKYPHLKNLRIILFLGRLDRQKACDVAIAAFSSAARLYPDIHLVMAGPNQSGWQTELEGLAKRLGTHDKITWTGMLAGEMKWGALLAADCFFLPSHHESFGVVVAEALSCGTPVVISNKVNIFREVIRYKAGIVSEDNPASASGKLCEWLSLPAETKRTYSENAKLCYKERFRFSAVASRLNALYQQNNQVMDE